ncbi:MAG TPA: hypothetical protein PKC28_11770 [Bdellovibrionales bacterium]|nr:hypothetical protein [Bdellovibrionales bacterium]
MKRLKPSFAVLSTILLVGFAVYASSYFAAEFMNASEAEKKWGTLPLNIEQFKAGDLSKRAPMAVEIVKRSLYVGKNRKDVRRELGDPDSYFFSDTIYAYKIMPFPGENKENWHLVFIPDDKLEKVKEVKIHKKCCYKSPL